MLLSAFAVVLSFAFLLVVMERKYDLYGLAPLGSMIIALLGLRVIEDGLVRQTDSLTTTIDFGEVPVGYLIAIAGALLLFLSMHRYRRIRL